MPPASDDLVIVPSHTPKPLPNYLRAELTSSLLSNSVIPVVQSTLYNASQDAGWIDAVLKRAKQLFNDSSQTWSPQEVLDILAKESRPSSHDHKSTPGGLRRVGQDRGSEDVKGRDGSVVDIRFPDRAILEGKQVIKQALEEIVEVEGTKTIN
ncbi:MAG: hypothetical protein L6R41_002942 [Letrouitia leprolyta]|nr:MAG: hypothetical protein L6R41_002942 [Letrouitia leprolyta]